VSLPSKREGEFRRLPKKKKTFPTGGERKAWNKRALELFAEKKRGKDLRSAGRQEKRGVRHHSKAPERKKGGDFSRREGDWRLSPPICGFWVDKRGERERGA